MFLPNTKGTLTPRTGRTRQGEPVFGQSRQEPCAVVRLSRMAEKTSVRADSSATRGNADELTMSAAKILFQKTSTIRIGDRFQIAGYDLIVASREPRHDVNGFLDHFECEFKTFSEDA